MNILLKEVFAGIFVSIACWNHHYDFLECIDKTSKFNSFAFTLSAVLLMVSFRDVATAGGGGRQSPALRFRAHH